LYTDKAHLPALYLRFSQHTSAYVSIRQHTYRRAGHAKSASINKFDLSVYKRACAGKFADFSETHRMLTYADVLLIPALLACPARRTPAYVSIRQHTSAYVSIRNACAFGVPGATNLPEKAVWQELETVKSVSDFGRRGVPRRCVPPFASGFVLLY
jgi:hypothetical protein